MQTVTIEQIKAAAREAYRDKLLTAQAPVGHRQQAYQSGKYRCAIGAVMTMDTLNRLQGRIEGAFSDGHMKLIGDFAIVQQIQSAHDAWLLHRTTSERNRFLKLIEYKRGHQTHQAHPSPR